LPDGAVADYYAGHCAGQPDAEIPADKLRRWCNRGYARDICAHAAGEDADAAQLLVKRATDGVVEIAWSLERNHHPVAVGVLSVGREQTGNTPLEAQAVALANAYLEFKGTSDER